MIITTTTSIKEKRIVKYCGNVTGMEVLCGTTACGSASDSLLVQSKDVTTCKGAVLKMVQEARSLGADAIVAMYIGFEMMARGDLVVVVYGTAVRCE